MDRSPCERGWPPARAFVWHLAPIQSDGEPDLAMLSAPERARAAGFGSLRRRLEFVAGRLAARHAIRALLARLARPARPASHAPTAPTSPIHPVLPRALVIDRDDDGAPRIEGLDVALALSISHGVRTALALVALGDGPIGADVCDLARASSIRRVAARAFPATAAPSVGPGPGERELAVGASATDADTCAAWAIKEAVGKALRLGLLEQRGFQRIELVSLDPPRVRVDGAPPDLALCVERRGGEVWAFAVGLSG